MRVVLLNQYVAPDEAATAQLLGDVAEGLVRAGHEVLAIGSDRSYAHPARRYPSAETRGGVRVRRVRATGFGRAHALGRLTDYATFAGGAAWALLRAPRPDVVLSLSTPPLVAALGVMVAKLRGARAVYWIMDVYPDVAFELGALRPGSLGGRTFRTLSRAVLAGSDRVVALGETMAARLEAAGARRVSVIHNWADDAVIRPRATAGHPLRREWGWEGSFVVLYSGNMGLAHEFDTVLEAARLLRDRPTVRFAFVGGGPRRAEVERAVRDTGLANVEFRPYVERERLGDSLTAAEIHLLTLRPGMPGLLVPSKIYGILAAGRPTLYVGPSAGEVHDLLVEGRCGTQVEVGDAPALARAVLAYAEDPARCAEEGSRARELFERRFTIARGVGAVVRLLEEAAG